MRNFDVKWWLIRILIYACAISLGVAGGVSIASGIYITGAANALQVITKVAAGVGSGAGITMMTFVFIGGLLDLGGYY